MRALIRLKSREPTNEEWEELRKLQIRSQEGLDCRLGSRISRSRKSRKGKEWSVKCKDGSTLGRNSHGSSPSWCRLG